MVFGLGSFNSNKTYLIFGGNIEKVILGNYDMQGSIFIVKI